MTAADTLERDATGESLLVNKRELARVLRCSLPTIDNLLDRYPDLPIVERGSHGVEWQFDADRVVAFLREKKDQEARQTAERSELLLQFSLPIDDTAPEESRGLSASGRKQMAEALRTERKLAMESGLLVVTSEFRQRLTPALIELGRFLDRLPQHLGRQFNLPPDVVRAMRTQIEDGRRSLVRNIGELAQQQERTDAAA